VQRRHPASLPQELRCWLLYTEAEANSCTAKANTCTTKAHAKAEAEANSCTTKAHTPSSPRL
jgi:hypothetical protein